MSLNGRHHLLEFQIVYIGIFKLIDTNYKNFIFST